MNKHVYIINVCDIIDSTSSNNPNKQLEIIMELLIVATIAIIVTYAARRVCGYA